ncbi:MAG: VOC family protein [Clostridiales bacterium]|nr:VOC family protein [Clostridiales bacterium]
MKFTHVTITVKNLEESLRFYQDIVGLPIKSRFTPMPGTEIAFLGDGETKIELIHNQARTEFAVGKDISLGFFVESVQETMESLQGQGIATSELFQPAPGVRFFYISDPNGVSIQFINSAA